MHSLGSPSRGRVGGAALAALAALTLAITLASTSPAQASGNCPGRLIEHKALTSGLGWLDVYYDAATGRNCARTVSSAATWGVQKWMIVDLVRCTSTKPTQPCGDYDDVYDHGSYRFYAGPVSIAARGRCIAAFGFIGTGTRRGRAQIGRIQPTNDKRSYGTHCG